MSLIDSFEPDPSLACPVCGDALTGWQSREGEGGLFVWQQGVAAPVDQEVDDEIKGLSEVVEALRLPARFEIYTQCCGGSLFHHARCEAPDGVWSSTTLETAATAWQRPGERREAFAKRLAWLRG